MLDLSIAKRTNIDETRVLEFRADMFNALNHPLFRNPETQSNRTTFGQISQTGTVVQGVTDPQTRVIQLVLKLIF